MIGWYVHHHGSGHLQRLRAVRGALDDPVTVLSSLPRPDDWEGRWVRLPRDDDGAPRDPEAGGRLHWAPVHHGGLRGRMASISAWLATEAPALMVSDVSVEVALLSRLHGVPVVCVAMPGHRGDPAHRLAYDVATALVGCWPPEARNLLDGLPDAVLGRVRPVGALSRFPVAGPSARRPGRPRVTVLSGTGGSELTADLVDRARAETPGWEWTVLGPPPGTWVPDPFPALCRSDVVVTHAGENALAEVAAARRPAIVVPAARPHGEQEASASALLRVGSPVVVRRRWPAHGWPALLEHAAGLDGGAWSCWCDGDAANRFADVVRETVAATAPEVA